MVRHAAIKRGRLLRILAVRDIARRQEGHPLEDATTVGLHVRIHGIEMPMHIGHVRIQDHGHDRGLDRADQGLYPTHLARASAALLENIERLGAGITTLHPEEGEDEVQVTLAIRAIATVVVVAAE